MKYSKIKIEDVTHEYLSRKIFINELIITKGFVEQNNEINISHFIEEKLGGQLILLSTSNEKNVKSPDLMWDNKFWEIKCVSSKSSIDERVRKGLKQIMRNTGGLILCLDECKLLDEEIIDIIMSRFANNKMFKKIDIVLVRLKGEEHIKVIRLIKQKVPDPLRVQEPL